MSSKILLVFAGLFMTGCATSNPCLVTQGDTLYLGEPDKYVGVGVGGNVSPQARLQVKGTSIPQKELSPDLAKLCVNGCVCSEKGCTPLQLPSLDQLKLIPHSSEKQSVIELAQ